MKTTKKISLPESEIPKQWYNILADMPQQPQPLLNPSTRQPIEREEMYGLFAKELVEQEFTKDKFVDKIGRLEKTRDKKYGNTTLTFYKLEE